MTSTPQTPQPGDGTAHVHTKTPRPDELSREAFQFIAAIDEFKRKHMRSFLDDAQVLTVAHELGWFPARSRRRGPPNKEEIERYAAARDAYRKRTGRLFPNWSEVFALLHELGYKRVERAA
jgi:hypothetical protein